MSGNNRVGVISRGIKTPVIKTGDDLQEIVISSLVNTVGSFDDGDIIGVTEAVVAISQANFASHKDIENDIMKKFAGAKELVVVDPIQSRNRFMDVLKAVAATPSLEKVYVVMTYPTDEVGNRLVSELTIMESGVQLMTKTQCEDFLICSIHRREETRKILEKSGAKRILDLSQIMDESIDGSGYNKDFGLYGTNLMSGGRLKLMPRDCQTFVEEIQQKILKRYGKKVEVFVYGDGAFKDPVGGIWELADPTTTLAATDGLAGTPKEVKLKYIASANEDKSAEEIAAIVAQESAKRKGTDDMTGEASLGTTPRRITDLIASLADLTTGSGDRQTPVVLIKNYL